MVRYQTPCVSNVVNGGTVPEACCNGIRTLYGLGKTTDDRQGLPSKCGLNLPYQISPSTDCKRI
ncbi:hypothetical protein TIFTF001_009800 [Ficus carica]|uniref:Non-specific lipid-transfer protein n=1 Tax=Ficus carica TaxID=3494 RepID=A0AA88D2X1_FICCA|nr:hypothetical protein TIFTF001_009800 [Ficus carica]